MIALKPYAYDDALAIARGRSSGYSDDDLAAVATIMATGVPMFHAFAAHAFANPPSTTCALCGGASDAKYLAYGNGSHALCNARAARGRPTPLIPYSVSCGCVNCGDTFNPDAYR